MRSLFQPVFTFCSRLIQQILVLIITFSFIKLKWISLQRKHFAIEAAFYLGIIDSGLPLLGWTLMTVNNAFCVGCSFFSWMVSMSTYYITILLSLDKCIAVLIPFKYREHSKPNICVLGTTLVCIFCCLFSVPALFVYEIDPETNECQIQKFDRISYDLFATVILPVIFLLSGVVPGVSVITLTTITVVRVRISARRRRSAQSVDTNSGQVPHSALRNREMTRLMVAMGVAFSSLCFCNIISIVVLILSGSSESGISHQSANRILTDILYTMTNSVNFYIYIVFGRKFRAHTLALLGLKKIEEEQNRPTRNRLLLCIGRKFQSIVCSDI